jgi:hypothetical protein
MGALFGLEILCSVNGFKDRFGLEAFFMQAIDLIKNRSGTALVVKGILSELFHI